MVILHLAPSLQIIVELLRLDLKKRVHYYKSCGARQQMSLYSIKPGSVATFIEISAIYLPTAITNKLVCWQVIHYNNNIMLHVDGTTRMKYKTCFFMKSFYLVTY